MVNELFLRSAECTVQTQDVWRQSLGAMEKPFIVSSEGATRQQSLSTRVALTQRPVTPHKIAGVSWDFLFLEKRQQNVFSSPGKEKKKKQM